MQRIEILVADNQWIVREGIRAIIRRYPELEIVAEASNRTELRESLKKHSPDVILLDCLQPEGFKPEVISFIRQTDPAAKVLIVSSSDSKADLLVTMEYGIRGLIFKECKEEEFILAIKAIASGEKFFCSKVINMGVDQKILDTTGNDMLDLSLREMEIVSLIVQGLPNKAIAERLMISVHTVSTHRKNIFRKLGVSNVSELILYAVRKGIIITPAQS